MNLKNYHKAQLKAAVYKLLSCPGVLTEYEVFDTLGEVYDELADELGVKNA